MTLYLDASALVKAFLRDETGSREVLEAMEVEASLATARHAFVESGRAIGRQLGYDHPALAGLRQVWSEMVVIDISQSLCERAVELAAAHGLRTLDALHLAAARPLAAPDLVFATWDRQLWDAAEAEGLETLPARRP